MTALTRFMLFSEPGCEWLRSLLTEHLLSAHPFWPSTNLFVVRQEVPNRRVTC